MNAGHLHSKIIRQGIGARIESTRQQLLSCGAVVAKLVEPQSGPLVADALRQITQSTCRIAVVGQIKSGKSTFINALVRHPKLLPTAVTPWTTAITNLHFGQKSPTGGVARFTFMNRNEWDDIARGAGQLRELTERLVPDFEPQLLQDQALALADRARKKLGPEFDQLLGRSHVYDTLAAGVLERYICSGEFSTAAFVGKYADITASADIYLPDGPFEFPTTITDTPGVNDPFLIRDEITRRSLGAADVYIIVLTARQPLSDQDVALLRLMRGLNKDRVVVLVNRIDELADVNSELPQVTAFVRDRLAQEFPDSRIPVVYGSAMWAMQALAFESGVVANLLKRSSAGCMFRSGLLHPHDAHPSALDDPEARQRVRQALYAVSGMPAVYDALDFMTGLAQPTFTLGLNARCLAEMSRACESAAKTELQMLLADRAQRQKAGTGNASLSFYAREKELLMEVAANIEASAQAIETLFVRVIDEEQNRLRSLMQQVIEQHAARERKVLVETLSRGPKTGTWTHEGVELRRALGDVFRHGYADAADRLTAFHARLIPELFKLMQSIVPAPDLTLPQVDVIAIPMPAGVPLSRMLIVDLDGSRWRAFWNRNSSAEQAGARIEALIKAEFARVADELADASGRTFRDFGTTTIRWALGACRNIQHALQRRLDRLVADQNAAGMGGSPSLADLEERIRVQGQRLKDTEALTQHLEFLTRDLEQVLRSGAAEP